MLRLFSLLVEGRVNLHEELVMQMIRASIPEPAVLQKIVFSMVERLTFQRKSMAIRRQIHSKMKVGNPVGAVSMFFSDEDQGIEDKGRADYPCHGT